MCNVNTTDYQISTRASERPVPSVQIQEQVTSLATKKRQIQLWILTSSQVGKFNLSEAKALWQLTSVVFCESTVFTNPSNTVSSLSSTSRYVCDSVPACSFCIFRSLRYLANCSGNPWRSRRSSRTDLHSSGSGLTWVGNGSSHAMFLPLIALAVDLVDSFTEVAELGGDRSFLFPVFCIWYVHWRSKRRSLRR